MTAEEKGFLSAIKKNPDDATARGAYADWLDEHGRHYDAMLQREAAGLSELRYKVRRKSDGLFSEGAEGHHEGMKPWTTRGKLWPKMAHLRAHLNTQLQDSRYRAAARRRNLSEKERDKEPDEFLYQGDTPLSDLEVVVVELRFVVGARMSLSVRPRSGRSGPAIDFTELGREGASPTE